MANPTPSSLVPLRGEIYDINWSPGRGSEQQGERPGLIIQRDTANQVRGYPVTIVLAISSSVKGYPSNVLVKPSTLNGLTKESEVLTGQVMTIAKDRLGNKRGKLSDADMDRVEKTLKYMLDLT